MANLSIWWAGLTALGMTIVSYNTGTGKAALSHVKTAYCLFLAFLLCCGLYSQVSTYLAQRVDDTLLNGMLYLYPTIADTLMSIIVIVSALYSAPTWICLINNDENKCILGSLTKYCIFKSIRGQLLASALIFVGPYLFDMFSHHSSLLSYIFVLYNYVALNQFSITLSAVRRIYESRNFDLERVCCANESEMPVARQRSLLGGVFSTELESLTPQQTQAEGPWRTDNLYRLRGQLHSINKLTRSLNWIFSLTNMGLVVHHGMLGVIYSYWGLRQALAKHRANDVGELIATFRSAAVSLLSIVWLVRPITDLVNEVERTQQIIQESMTRPRDKQFMSELKTFSLELLLAPVSFSPYGFFEMSNELLLSMGSAIASYLVILLQYQIMLDEQDTCTTTP